MVSLSERGNCQLRTCRSMQPSTARLPSVDEATLMRSTVPLGLITQYSSTLPDSDGARCSSFS